MFFLLLVVQAASAPTPLYLSCGGGGTANKPAVATINTHSSTTGMVGTTPVFGSTNGSGTITGQRQQDFADQVDVRLFDGDDRIRLPRTMLPPIRGGKDGWFKLKNVVADNFMNNPNVFIDRVTGTISISGRAGDYSGRCEAIPADAPAKF